MSMKGIIMEQGDRRIIIELLYMQKRRVLSCGLMSFLAPGHKLPTHGVGFWPQIAYVLDEPAVMVVSMDPAL